MPPIVDNIFVEADPGFQFFVQQVDFVEEARVHRQRSRSKLGRWIGSVTHRISWMFARSLELQTYFQMSRLSSRRFTLASSAKRWSKQLTGARKMMELMLSK